MLTNILIKKLIPHPNNPRHELGDLTELTESIKVQGILQNLTVVQANDGMYTVIIGHRRLAAANLTDLTEVPCVITEMDEKTQISTMLLENMQRVDLTPYEQAQGFQMCLDLGVTVDELSSKTGFSKKTIKHRLEMMKLDKTTVESFKHATIDDYIQLECIDDLEDRNKLLKNTGSNFNYEVKQAFRNQERTKFTDRLIKKIIEIRDDIKVVEKISNSNDSEYFMNLHVDDQKQFDDALEKVKKKLNKNSVYVISKQFGYSLYKLNPRSANIDVDKKEIERKKRSLKREFNNQFKTCLILRKEFVQELVKRKITSEMQQHLIKMLTENQLENKHLIDKYKRDELEKTIGYKLLKVNPPTAYFDQYMSEEATEEVNGNQCINLLIMSIYNSLERFGFETNTISLELKYSPNKLLEFIYKFIEGFGYITSDVEKSLVNGTHELFNEIVPNEK